MRYKRRRYYKKSTNVIRMKFQSFMDISTSADGMQIISINAGGKEIVQRCPLQFQAYKYYKIGNISAKLVPASTLPVDPTGLSYEAGENTVDPRDQLTPGMMRITNGEDVFENISGLTSDEQHALYNNMLLDPRWYKWMLQTGVKRHATPRYWQIGQLHQDKWPGATLNVPKFADTTAYASGAPNGTGVFQFHSAGVSTGTAGTAGVSFDSSATSELGLFQVGHRGVLGWLPTDGMFQGLGSALTKAFVAAPPTIEVMKLVLPKAYKTSYFYRLFISETVYFKDPIVAVTGYQPLDVFHRMSLPVPNLPSNPQSYNISDSDTGGNYGDDSGL